MNLKQWRKANRLTLEEAAIALGINAKGTLHKIEHGAVWASPETSVVIQAASAKIGPKPVEITSHIATWQKKHPQKVKDLRKAGRIAADEYLRTLKARNGTNGKR